MYANIYEVPEKDSLNFAYIPEAFASPDTTTQTQDTTSSSFTIEARQLLLSDIRFDYKADSTVANIALGELSLLLETLGLSEEHIRADELAIDELLVDLQLPRTSAPDSTAQPEAPTPDSLKNIINPSGYNFSLADFSINNSRVAYQVGLQDGKNNNQQINFENLLIADLGVQIEDIEVRKTEASLNLGQFTFTERKSGFTLAELVMTAQVDMPQVRATLQQLQTGHSDLNGTVAIELSLEESMADLINSLSVQSQLDRAVLSLTDASYFTNALDSMPALKNAEANLWWQVNIADGDGSIDGLQLRLADQLSLEGEIQFSDLTKIDSTVTGSPHAQLSVKPLRTNLGFIRQIVGENAGLPQLANDTLVLQASAEGQLDDIDGELSLRSSVGRLLAEGSYQQSPTGGMNVSASVKGQQLQLKRLLQALGQDTLAQDFNMLTFQARVSAQQSVTPYDTAFSQAEWDVLVNEVDYKDYKYEGLNVEGYLADEQLTNQISYQDSLLDLSAEIGLDMGQPDLAYELDLTLANANLYRLNLINDSIALQDIRLIADLRGTNPDSILGTVQMPKAIIIKDTKEYKLDSLLVKVDQEDDTRRISFHSDYVDALISGNFSVNKLPSAFEDFEQYYFTSYESPYINQDTVNTFEADEQRLRLQLQITETPVLARAFVPSLAIPDTVSLEASFNSLKKTLWIDLKAPHIEYGSNIIDSLYVYAITTKRQINFDLLTRYVQVGGLNIPQFLMAGKLSGAPSENQPPGRERLATTNLDLNVKMGEDKSPYRLDLNTQIRALGDTVTVLMGNSEVVLDSADWKLSDQGRIVYAQNYLNIDQLYLKRNKQELRISTQNTNDLQVAINQFEIQPFLNSIDLEDLAIEGILHGQATMKDIFQSGPITADLNIDHLTVRDTLLGDFILQAKKATNTEDETDLLSVLSTLKGPNGNLLIDGTYNLATNAESPIDLQLELNDFLLAPWQIFLEEQVNELSGELFADLSITGSPAEPNVEGTLRFGEYVAIEPTISSALYHIRDQEIRFSGEEMRLNNFTILDSAETPAVLDGTIAFSNLADPSFNLTFETEEFMFVNSQSYENEAFYGIAIASADASINGPVSSLMIEGEMGVNEGTNMTISLVSDPAEVQRAGYIEFIDVNALLEADTVTQDSLVAISESQNQEDSVSISGFSLDADVHLNPEAEFTIIIDPARGDKITAAGEADLQVNMQPNGDLNLQGTYTINRGQYVLNFAQVVKREFAIREGSTIAWSGDPANARMDLTAAYEVETDLEELFQDILDEGGSAYNDLEQLVSTDRPVFVELLIDGTLTEPQLAFDLGLPEITAGGISSDLVSERLNQIEQNETELYKQVFGLIVLGRFIPLSGGFGSGDNSGFAGVNEQINSSVSQLLTDQLSKLTEEYLGGVELSVDLESAGQNQTSLAADRDINVELSKQLFNDRLTVKVGGMTNTGNAQGAQSSNQIYGEFEVLYELTESGNLLAKIFQISDRDQILSQVQQRQGASILYKRSFNRLFQDGFLQDRPEPTKDEEESVEVKQDAVREDKPRAKKIKDQ